MADVLFVLLLAALFAPTAGFVRVCDRMLGGNDVSEAVPAAIQQEKVAA